MTEMSTQTFSIISFFGVAMCVFCVIFLQLENKETTVLEDILNKTAELKKAEKMMDIMYTDAEYYLEYRLGMHTFEEFVDFAKIGNHNSMWINFLENNIDRIKYDLESLMKKHNLVDFGNIGNTPIYYDLLNNSFHSLVDCDALMEIVWSPEESCPTDLEQSHWKSVDEDIEDIMLYAREKDADLRQSVMKTLKVLINDTDEV